MSGSVLFCGDGQTKPGGTLALPPILFGRAADHER